MPQMAPVLWLLMFSFFLISLLFMTMNYFVDPYFKIEDLGLKTIKTDKDWKW